MLRRKGWTILLAPEFEIELASLSAAVRVELLARAARLSKAGPLLGRPAVDTLKGSAYANKKELRFDVAGGVWRAAFAFDPARHAVILVAGDKSGIATGRFYRELLRKADARYSAHLARLNGKGDE